MGIIARQINIFPANGVSMKKGTIIFLNGVSSAGKSTLVRALQRKLPEPYFCIGFDTFTDVIAQCVSGEFKGEELDRLWARAVSAMHHTIRLYSDLGNNVIIDHVMLMGEKSLPECVALLHDYPVLLVKVACPLPELQRREKERGDRQIGTAEGQVHLLNPQDTYDIVVDTHANASEECADQIIQRLNQPENFNAFKALGSQRIRIRKAQPDDLDFLAEADLLSDGCALTTDEEKTAHRLKISAYVHGPDDAGWIPEEETTGEKAGMILVRFRDRYHEPDTEANRYLFRYLDESLFPKDGRFCEIFQLWVAPAYRRRGIATRLKQEIEQETRRRGIQMIYTHTEAVNKHVIELNHKLGYQPVRRGTIGDNVLMVSLAKWVSKADS